MKKETQDRLWAVLSKDEREELRIAYSTPAPNAYSEGYDNARKFYFGHHNLTSDEEPEEMLMVKRKTIADMYAANERIINDFDDEKMKDHSVVINGMLESLFGDKCLPDKEPSIQGEPKFKVGDKVRVLENADLVNNRGKIATIIKEGQCCKGYGWVLDISKSVFLESELEPYTEPETKMKTLNESFPEASKIIEDNFWDLIGNSETKENMEEKELNLCELLKGCEKETFYSPMLSDVFIVQIRETSIHIVPCDDGHSERSLFIDKCGVWAKGGQCVLYPSRALYEKYPLDARKAWSEWAESRTPKRWRAKHTDAFFYITNEGDVWTRLDCRGHVSDANYNFGNYFRTKEQAKQATEAVRECLMKFHKDHAEI